MTSDVVRLFDAMAPEYDVLEPWYAHLYPRLHAIVSASLAPPGEGRRRRALDCGCGTGFQAALLAGLGYVAHGVDLAARLLAVARARLPQAPLTLGAVEALPYADGSFDAVACCGSTLNFVGDPTRAIAELGRVLRPGGVLLLDCEHAWSLDVAWMVAGTLGGNAFGYGLTPREAWRLLARRPSRGCVVRYPGYGAIRLFTMREVRAMLGAGGLAMERVWGLHMLTNLLPSTVLHRPSLSRPVAAVFRALAAADDALRCLPGHWRIANSLVVLARKPAPRSS